jgi:hypothetical protein
MSNPAKVNVDRRSFLKWSLLGLLTLGAGLVGFGKKLSDTNRDRSVFDLTSGPTVRTDACLGDHCRLTATQDFFLANPVNARHGQRMVWEILQDGAGGHAMTLDHKFAFGSDLTQAVLSAASGKRDFLTAIYNGSTDKWYVVAFIRGY